MALTNNAQEKLRKFLELEFSSVYCDTCRHVGNEDRCDYCSRKSMNWAISDGTVNTVLCKISEALEEEDNE